MVSKLKLFVTLLVAVSAIDEVTEYVKVDAQIPGGKGHKDIGMDVTVRLKGEMPIAGPTDIMNHVKGAWDHVVEENQEGLSDAKLGAVAAQPLLEEEAWHHYKAGRGGVVDSARFLITFNMIPSIQTGGSPLFTAAALGDIDKIHHLIEEESTDPNIQKSDGSTPLHAAATMCKSEAVKTLLVLGADPNIVGDCGATPLMMASAIGCTSVIESLLTTPDIIETDINQKHKFAGNTALHFAAEMGRGEAIKLLCDHKADIWSEKSTGGIAIHTAADSNQTEAVAALIASPCNSPLNTLMLGDTTPLYLAAQRGQVEVCRVLVEAGALINFVMPKGKFHNHVVSHDSPKAEYGYEAKNTEIGNGATALHAATENGHLECVKYLLSAGAIQSNAMEGATPLVIALQYRHPHIALALLDVEDPVQTAKVNEKVPVDGSSPLFVAVGFGYQKVVEKLLEIGADVTIENNQGATPLSNALRLGNDKIASILYRYGAASSSLQSQRMALLAAIDSNNVRSVSLVLSTATDSSFRKQLLERPSPDSDTTPLHSACLKGSLATVKLLHKAGASLDDVVLSSKATPLMLAVRSGSSSLCEYLISVGSDPNTRAGKQLYWATPLYLASQAGNVAIIKLLLEKGAKIDSPLHKINVTPLFIAAENGHTESVELLIGKGASVHAMNSDRFSILQTAVRNGKKNVVEILLSNGANASHKDRLEDTPLLTAIRNSAHPEILKLLIATDPTHDIIKYTKSNGYGAIHCLAEANIRGAENNLLDFLRSAGAPLGSKKDVVETPAMYAARHKNNIKMLEKLIQMGDSLQNSKTTALHIALEHNNKEGCKRILKSGFNIDTPNSDGIRVDYQVRVLLGDVVDKKIKKQRQHNDILIADIFLPTDDNNDEMIARNELFRSIPAVRSFFGLPDTISQSDESLRLFEDIFQSVDTNSDRKIAKEEFLNWANSRNLESQDEEL